MPRSVSNRVTVDPVLFKEDRHDIFVFKGFERYQLTNLVKGNSGTSVSSDEIFNTKLSARYILLEETQDWESLREIADRIPMHCIKVENYTTSSEYILEASTNLSSIIQYTHNSHHSTETSIPHADFIRNLTIADNTTGICICDEPGMGKSWLLANIAKNVLQACDDVVGCFISLESFMCAPEDMPFTTETAIRDVLRYSRTSPLSIEILFYLVHEKKCRLECFFDGFDELKAGQRAHANGLISVLNQCDNIRVFVTARPHMRKHLEGLQGVTAFDIMPFTTAEQVEYLKQNWQEKLKLKKTRNCTSDEIERLHVFSNTCVPRFPKHKYDSENAGLGVPLMCSLLASVYQRPALLYAEMKSDRVITIPNTTHRQFATDLFSKYLDVGMEKVKNVFDERRSKQILEFHFHTALQLILPNYLIPEMQTEHELLTEADKLAFGFLRKTTTGYEFSHRMFPEFLVSKYVAGEFANNRICIPLVTTFFKDLLRFHRIGPGNWTALTDFHPRTAFEVSNQHLSSYVLNYRSLAEFLDSILPTLGIPQFNLPNLCQNIFEFVDETNLFKILLACIRGNLINVLRLVCDMISISTELLTKAKAVLVFRDETDICFLRCWQLLVTSAQYGGPEMGKQVRKFLWDIIETIDVLTIIPEWMSTPLHVAIKNADYKCAEYFHELIPLKQRCLLYYLVGWSTQDSKDIIKTKEQIIRLLVQKDYTILHESCVYRQTLDHSEPICSKGIHLKLLKVLVKLGANVCATDFWNRTVLQTWALHSDEQNMVDFLRFLYEELDEPIMNILILHKDKTNLRTFVHDLYLHGLELPSDLALLEESVFSQESVAV